MKIIGLVPVRNEAANLPRCLASVAWASEVWVVDSQSTDTTTEIATAAGARVVQFAFGGTWPKKKNWALETLAFAHEWVLLDRPKKDRHQQVLGGLVVAHATDREVIDRHIETLPRPFDVATHFTGPLDTDREVVYCL